MITLTLGHVILLQKFRQRLGEQVPQLDLAEGIVVGYIGASLGLLSTAQARSDGVHQHVHGGLLRHLPLAAVDGLAVDPEHGVVGDVGVHEGDAVGGCVLGKLLADIPNEEAQILTVGLGIGHREGVGFSLHPAHALDLHVIVLGDQVLHAGVHECHELGVQLPRFSVGGGREPLVEQVCPAPGAFDDEEGAIGVGLAELFRQTKLGAEAPFDLPLQGGALDEFSRGVSARYEIDVDVVVAALVFGIRFGGDVALEVFVQAAPRGVGLSAQKDDGGLFAAAVGQGVPQGKVGLALQVWQDPEQKTED